MQARGPAVREKPCIVVTASGIPQILGQTLTLAEHLHGLAMSKPEFGIFRDDYVQRIR